MCVWVCVAVEECEGGGNGVGGVSTIYNNRSAPRAETKRECFYGIVRGYLELFMGMRRLCLYLPERLVERGLRAMERRSETLATFVEVQECWVMIGGGMVCCREVWCVGCGS